MRHPALEQQIIAIECMLEYHLSELKPDIIPTLKRDLTEMQALASKIRSLPSNSKKYRNAYDYADELVRTASNHLFSAKA